MIIQDIPQSGKRGLNVSQQGRFSLVSRTLAIPTNPRTPAQRLMRARLTQVTNWSTITQAQRDAWTTIAKGVNARSRLGQTAALTGQQLFTKVNCNNLMVGGAIANTPPAPPAFEPLPITALTITSLAGVATLKLTTTDTPSEGAMLRGAEPVTAGSYRAGNMTFLGLLDSPVGNAVDITAAYKAKYGEPTPGRKVFVQVNQNNDGYEDYPIEFSAIVPAGS